MSTANSNVTDATPFEGEAQHQPPTSLDKGKGKGKARAVESDLEDDDDNDDDDDDDEDEDEDYNVDDDELAELIEDEEELVEIDPSNIVYTGRRRNAPLDYSSEEALKQAGLDAGSVTAEQEDEDTEFRSEEMLDE